MSAPLAVSLEAAGALAGVHAASFERPWSAADLAALMESPGVVALAAGTADPFEGFILVRAVAGEAEILTLAVRPDARRRGIARALVEAAASAAAGMNAETLWLEVAADNDAALALYAAAGFEPAGRRPAYYARGDAPRADALVLRRTLQRTLAPARS